MKEALRRKPDKIQNYKKKILCTTLPLTLLVILSIYLYSSCSKFMKGHILPTTEPIDFLTNTSFFGKLNITQILKDIERWNASLDTKITHEKSHIPLLKLKPGKQLLLIIEKKGDNLN